MKLSSRACWVVWLFIHVAFRTGYRNRIGVIITWWLAFTRDVRRQPAERCGRPVGFCVADGCRR
jgi:NADH dehydrogenase